MTDADSFDLFNEARARFLSSMASEHLSSSEGTLCSVVILTHLLADRPVFIEALSRYLTISRVIAIPYSTDQRVADWVAARFTLAQPSLQELQQGGVVRDALLHDGTAAQILIEIGGYGARVTSGVGRS
ncbi:hypothetical protein [Brevundimonas sp.]|uniref:hypothetical protein n=1 Tax=Brevundimonas sp. TaxID=1871086 RepID=UPI003F724746